MEIPECVRKWEFEEIEKLEISKLEEITELPHSVFFDEVLPPKSYLKRILNKKRPLMMKENTSERKWRLTELG